MSSGPTAGWIGPPADQLELLYGELKNVLEVQLQELDGLDRKATAFLTPLGLLLGLGVNLASKVGPSIWARGLFYGGLVGLLVGVLSGIRALRVRDLEFAPTAAGLWPDFAMRSREETLAELCSAVTEAFTRNAGVRGTKTPWIRGQYIALLVGTLLTGAGLSIQALGILR